MTDQTHPPSPIRRARRRMAVLVVGIVLAVAACGFLGLCLFIDRYGQADRAQPAQAIVILGAKVDRSGQPGDSLRERTLLAAALYRQGLAPAVICTGGNGRRRPSESSVQQSLLERHGVPSSAIFREEMSRNTWENARYALEICRAHGWTRVVLVSDPYHLYRGRRNFQAHGLTAYPSPAYRSDKNRIPAQRAFWTAREAAGVIRDVLLGRY